MRTKEDIFKKCVDGDRTKNSIYLAMDEYAKEQAVAFAEWIVKNKWIYDKLQKIWINRMEDENNISIEYRTTAELYELFTN